MTSTLLCWIASILVGISKAGFGAGVGILAVPLMTIAISPTRMLGVLLPLLIAGDIFSLLHYPKTQNFRNLSMLIPGCLLGIGIGSLLLKKSGLLAEGERTLRVFIGVICVVIVLIQLYLQLKVRHKINLVAYKPKIWQGVTVRIIAGITSTLAHAAGPIILLFLLPQKLEKRVFMGTALVYFFVGNSAKLIPYIAGNIITRKTILESVHLIPWVIGGTLLGAWLNKKISGKIFSYIVYGITLLTGIGLLMK